MFAGPFPRVVRVAVSLASLTLLAACADTRGGPIPYNQKFAAPDAPTLQTLQSDYKIAPMDKLAIKVFKSDDLSGDYDVDSHVMFVVESGSTRTRAGIEALNRLEATGAHVLGAALTKASADASYGYGRYGYGYAYGRRSVDKRRTEILMIPQGIES